ncbi:MAG: hypothetical protein PVG19_09440 [Desulfobacterales bacterium]
MEKKLSIISGLTLAATFLALGLTAAAEKTTAYEKPPIKLNAALIVPDGKMEGKGYQIEETALNDGYSNTYNLKTEVGTVDAVSDYQLARQIQEVRALIILDEMSRAGVFGEGMKNGLMAPLKAGKALITDPVDTTTGAIKGVGRWMGNIGRAITSDDPYQEGGVSAAVGWAGAKRAYALKLGVDPYTDWEPLQEGLTSVAQAAFAGGITVGVAMGKITEGTTVGTVTTVLSLSGDMNKILLDNPPEGLTKINREKLVQMNIPQKTTDPFLANYNYTPMEKTLLVESLKRMDGAQGRDIFLSEAASAPDREVARYMQQRAEMMANYHNKTMATDIIKIDKTLWQLNRKGTLLGIFPIDYLAWTTGASRIAASAEKSPKAKQREIWLEGSASPESNKALTARGWKVKERVGLLTGNPLQNQTAASAGAKATTTVIKTITP